MRFPSILALLLVAGFAASADTPLNLKTGGTDPTNVVSTAAIAATENTLTLTLSQGAPRTVMFFSADTDWYYRSSTGGTNCAVAKGQTLTLTFNTSTVVYYIDQTTTGNLTILPLK